MSRPEECRREVRAYLAERPALAFSCETIRRALRNFTEAEVTDALSLLTSLDQATEGFYGLGSTKYFKATAKGVLAHERDE